MNKKIKFLFSFMILLFTIFGCSTCNKIEDMGKEKTIKYEVSGTAKTVSITMNNATGGTEQFSEVPTPWSETFKMKSGFLYISAQNQTSSGTVTVKIYVDGKVTQQSTSEGEYVIATASEMIH